MRLHIVCADSIIGTHTWTVPVQDQRDADAKIKKWLVEGVWHDIAVGECFHPPASIISITFQEN